MELRRGCCRRSKGSTLYMITRAIIPSAAIFFDDRPSLIGHPCAWRSTRFVCTTDVNACSTRRCRKDYLRK